MTFTNWVHTEQLQNFSTVEEKVVLDAYQPNGEWNLLSADTFRYAVYYDSIPYYGFPHVGFRIKMSRVATYYLFNIVTPVTVLSLLTALVFVLPCDSGEKVCPLQPFSNYGF